jgi:hypothetical protein
MLYLTEDLVASVKRRCLAPASQKTFQDADIIALLNEEMQISLVPDLLSIRGDYFLKSKEVSIAASTTRYPITERAIGNALKDVAYRGTSGSSPLPLSRLTVRDCLGNAEGGEPSGYYVEGDEIVLNATPSTATGSIIQWYYSRPNELVPTADCAKITAVSSLGGTTTFTVDTDISSSVLVGSKVDFLNSVSPYLLWSENATVTAITATTIAVATTEVDNEAGSVAPGVDDYICAARTANIVQLPEEYHPILCQMVAARIMEALGDMQKLQAVNIKLSEMRKQALTLVANRVESAGFAVVNRSGIASKIRG